jgi:hypothetical protein
MKKMFVWESVDGLTGNYHDGGGTLVIAEDLGTARELLKKNGVSAGSGVFKEEPSFVAPVMCDEDKVFIFPDAGCC